MPSLVSASGDWRRGLLICDGPGPLPLPGASYRNSYSPGRSCLVEARGRHLRCFQIAHRQQSSSATAICPRPWAWAITSADGTAIRQFFCMARPQVSPLSWMTLPDRLPREVAVGPACLASLLGKVTQVILRLHAGRKGLLGSGCQGHGIGYPGFQPVSQPLG